MPGVIDPYTVARWMCFPDNKTGVDSMALEL